MSRLLVAMCLLVVGGACGEASDDFGLVQELGVIDGIVDVDAGTVELSFVPQSGQALTAIAEDQNGVVGTANVSQAVEFIVECRSGPCAAPFQAPATVTGGCGAVNSFEFDVTMRSFFPEGLKSAHVRFDSIQPLDNALDFSLCNEDPVSPNFTLGAGPLTRGAGLIRYSGLAGDANGGAAGGPVDAADTVRWRFRAPGGRFRFRAVAVAEVCTPQTCGVARVVERFWQVEGVRSTSGAFAVAETAGNVFIGGEFSYVGPRTGTGARITDHTVSNTAAALTWPAIEGGRVRALVDDGGGGAFIGGDFTSVGGVARAGIAHIQADGSVGTLNANVTGSVNALALTPTHVVVGGAFTAVGGVAIANLAAVSRTTGAVDATWGVGANATVRALAVDGTALYVGGDQTAMGATATARVSRLTAATGVVDAAFAAGIGIENGSVNALVVAAGAPSGGSRVFVGGTFTGPSLRTGAATATRTRMAAIDAGNLSALAFAPAPNASVNALGFVAETIVLGGAFTKVGGSTRQRLARVNATTGAVITAFNPSVGGGSVDGLDVSDDGSTVYLAGTFTQIDGVTTVTRLAAVSAATGGLGSWRVVVGPNNGNTTAGNVVLARTGEVLVGGLFGSVAGFRRNAAVELDLNTGEPTSWDPGLAGATPTVRAISLHTLGVLLGGSFTAGAATNLAIVNETTGALVTGYTANGNVNGVAVADGVSYLGGAFTTINGATRNRLAALNAAGVLTAWAPSANANVNAVAVTNQQVYVGGAFSTVNGATGSRLVSIGLDGGANSGVVTKNWSANSTVNAIAACRDVAVAVGFFSLVDNLSRSGFVTLGPTAVGPRQFSPTGALTTAACAGNSVSLGGASLTGSTRVGQINLFNSNQTTIDHQFNSSAVSVTVQVGDLQFVGGSFANFGSIPRTGLIVFLAD